MYPKVDCLRRSCICFGCLLLVAASAALIDHCRRASLPKIVTVCRLQIAYAAAVVFFLFWLAQKRGGGGGEPGWTPLKKKNGTRQTKFNQYLCQWQLWHSSDAKATPTASINDAEKRERKVWSIF